MNQYIVEQNAVLELGRSSVNEGGCALREQRLVFDGIPIFAALIAVEKLKQL